jgi:hypothetical protein
MKRPRWYRVLLTVFLGRNILVPLLFRSAVYQGKVVDEETGQPIAEAVVTVIWYHSPIIQMDQTRSFQIAKEAVTSADGQFSLWTWPGFDFNPFTYVLNPPDAIIYRAGYAPLARATTYDRGYSTYESLAEALKKGIVIKLPRLKTKEEARHFSGVDSLSVIDVRSDRIPKLFQQVNAHRKAIGLMSPIY